MNKQNLKSVTEPCCKDAEQILDLSQGQPSRASPYPGHPRFHVLCRSNTNLIKIIEELPTLGCTEAVTQHLMNTKTAFQNKDDQNQVLHEILSSDLGREALNLLNNGRNEVLLRVSTNALHKNKNLMMTQVTDGNRLSTTPATSLVLILGHHVNKPEGMYVHVKTFYPTARHIAGYEIEVLR